MLTSQIRSHARKMFTRYLPEAVTGNAFLQDSGRLLEDLLALLEECHDQPVIQMRAAIRRRVIECMFMGHAGDCAMHEHNGPSLEIQVDILVTMLERIRQQAMRKGQWSEQASPPLMCG